jgi:hypothetical protein
VEKKLSYESLARMAVIIVLCELKYSVSNSPKLSSAQEGFALLQKHVDDLSASSSNNKRSQLKIAKRVAAAALRYMVEICLEGEANDGQDARSTSSGGTGRDSGTGRDNG